MIEQSKNDLIFNVLDWHEFDESIDDDDNNKKYVIKAFGRTENFESVYLRIEDFPPHFYILLPESWKDNLEAKYDHLISVLKSKNSSLNTTLIKYEEIERKKFYGFNAGKKFKFLRLIFTTKKSMMDTARMFDNKIHLFNNNSRINIKDRFIKFDVYESNIDPYIRFMHIRNLVSCGWIKIENEYLKKNHEPTTCTYNYTVTWDNVNNYEYDKLAPFYICSFDLECKSGDGSFPQASRIDDKIIQIGMTFTKYGSSEIVKKIMISLNTCDPIDNTEVIECESERELLLSFQEIIQREDPDIITGYNIFSFDQPYLMDRAKHPNIKVSEEFYHLSKLKNHKCKLILKNLSSSALGDNKMYYIDTLGRVNIDLMKVVQRDYKLNSYKLDSVAENFFKDKISNVEEYEDNYKINSKNINILKIGNYIRFEKDGEIIQHKYKIIDIDYHKGYFIINDIDQELLSKCKLFWGMVKDDIKPRDIFELYEKTSSDRKLIAEYCIQDCALVSNLMSKLEIITNNIGMASVCHVPLHYIFFRGQGIKCLSLVAKYCRSEGYLIPVMKKIETDDTSNVGYEGATVFDPEIGFHRKPIPVLDYNSLYPSSIISKNVSHETLVSSSEYDNLKDYIYYDVYYNNHDGSQTHCRYAKKIDKFLETEPGKSKFGILPTILMKLLTERKLTKKEMAKESDPFKKSILDGKQTALKLTANSIYGQLGAPTSPIYFKHGAASTTAIGRDMLCLSKEFVETKLSGILNELYQADLNSDEELYESILKNYLSERDLSFESFLREFIRDIFSKYIIEPRVVYGDSVMPYTPVLIKINDQIKIISVEELGNIFQKPWEDYSLFKNQDSSRHSKERIILDDINIFAFTNNGWSPLKQLIRHKCNKAIYRVLTHTGLVDVTEDHSLILESGEYIKPKDLNTNNNLMHNFPIIEEEITNIKSNDSHIDLQHLYYSLKLNGYNISIDEDEIIRLNYSKDKLFDNPKQLKKIYKLFDSYDGYVYDLTTEEGVFQAGIGELIVKNTDSIFINMNLKDKNTLDDIYDKQTLQYNIDLGKCTSKFLKTLLPYPHNMEYEKTFYPFAIMAKKKYIGNKFEDNTEYFKQTSMGVVLKRRDNANIVKKIVGGMVNIMMNEIDIDKTIRFMKKSINDLLKGRFGINEFITSKTLRAEYVDRTRMAHVVLADRMAERDPGNAPQLNDRIPFVAIEVPVKKGQKLLQGHKIEHPEYIIDNNLKIDYLFYLTNQIKNPSIQFLELIMKPHEAEKLFIDFIIKEEDRKKGVQSLFKFNIKRSDTENDDSNFDILIDKSAKPNNTVKSKKQQLLDINDLTEQDI
jgi:DNA polymerase elongation subunit (family B)